MRLKEKMDKVAQEMAKKYSLPLLALPKISKVTLNVGIGQHKDSKEDIEHIEKQFTQIIAQKPKKTQAKISISGFKVRQGQHIGFCATLRGKRMYDFLERLNTVVFPRSREFDGVSLSSMDSSNNLTFAFKEQLVFPEIKQDETKFGWGMSVTLTIKNAENKELVIETLKEAGFVFK